tara:strand:- start:702 stop:941 length:240 start_codon:yes stop_codon:yes gene_type:complete
MDFSMPLNDMSDAIDHFTWPINERDTRVNEQSIAVKRNPFKNSPPLFFNGSNHFVKILFLLIRKTTNQEETIRNILKAI